MTTVNIKNEIVKRKFFRWLKEAHGRCDSTVNSIEKAIWIYEDFTGQADFATFNSDKAVEFKEWLKKRKNKNKPLSLTTYCTYLRYLHTFFLWLSWQPGYKSKITLDKVAYLKALEKENRIATQFIPRNFPLQEYVIKLAGSINARTEIDKRDRAMISFALLSGMRNKAIVTLPLGCLDENDLTIDQNPKLGVDTKFSKHIPTTIFKFDDKLLGYVDEWVKLLKSKGFGSQDPLFPRSKTDKGEDELSFETASEVEPVFWQGTGRVREIFKNRAKEAGLPYFPPHTFRHSATALALKGCKNGEEIKAISQNFGHKDIATTLSSYANYHPQRLSEIIKNMDFSGKPMETPKEMFKELLKENFEELRKEFKKSNVCLD
jgi:integrase/recombinase XerD